MTTLKQEIEMYHAYISSKHLGKNGLDVKPEIVKDVPDRLASLVHNMLCEINDEPKWDELSDEKKYNVKEHIAKNPLWLSNLAQQFK